MKNSKNAARHIGRRALSIFLAIAMVLPGICFFTLPENAEAALNVTAAAKASLVVPDTIYLKPSSGNATEFQFYLNNNTNGTVKTGAADTTGKIYFNLTGATDIKATLSGTNVSVDLTNGTEKEFTGNMTNGGVASGKSQVLMWTFSFTVNGKACTTQAYTVAYAPFTQVTGAAGRTRNNNIGSGKITYVQSIVWWQGINSIGSVPSTDNTSDGNGLNEDISYVPASNFNPMISTPTTTGTAAINGYLTSAASGQSNSIKYGNTGDKTNTNWVGAFVTGYTANVMFDISRYGNINQVPNLKCGAFVSDYEGATADQWYYVSLYNTTGTDKYRNCYTQSDNNKKKYADPRDGTYIFTDKTSDTSKKIDSGTGKAGILYNGTVSYPITSAGTYSFAVKSFVQGHYSGASYCYSFNCLYAPISITAFSKSPLRTLIFGSYGRVSDLYTASSWYAYQTALKAACEVLGNPAASACATTDTAYVNLNNAINGLTLKTGTLNISEKSSTNISLSDGSTETYNYGDTFTVTAPAHNGYTCTGYTMEKNLFNFEDYASDGVGLTYGANTMSATADKTAKTIAVTYTGAGGEGYVGQPKLGSYDLDRYMIPVKPGEQYRVTFDTTNKETYFGMFWAYRDRNVGNYGDVHKAANDGLWLGQNNVKADDSLKADTVITVPDDAGYMYFRLTGYASGTLSNIKICKVGETLSGTGSSVSFTYANYGEINLVFNYSADKYYATFVKKFLGESATTIGEPIEYTIESSFNFPTSTATTPAVEYEEYYRFDGKWKVTTPGGSWIVNDETLYNGGASSVTGNHGNVTFTAQFTPLQYQIKFLANGGTIHTDGNVDSMAYNVTTTGALPVASKEGYKFTGWVPEETVGNWAKGTAYTSFDKMHGSTEGDIVTLKANWQVETYTVTIDIPTGQSIAYEGLKTRDYNTENAVSLGTATRPGYTFTGWQITAAAGNWVKDAVFADTLPAGYYGNVTLTPTWTINTYTLGYNLIEGATGENCGTRTYKVTDTITLGSATRNGYDFAGWAADDTQSDNNWVLSAGTYYSAGETVSGKYGNMVLTAVWNPKTYTITLDPAGGTCEKETVDYNIAAGVSSLVSAKRDGYVFNGWQVKANSGNWTTDDKYNGSVAAGKYGDVTFTALWTPADYEIRFVTTGSSVAAIPYTITSEAFTLPASTLTGYVFNCWKVVNPAGNWAEGESFTTSSPVSGKWGTVELHADFTAIAGEITYKDKNGSQWGDKVSYTIASPVTLRTDYAVAGYTFNGWKVESTAGNWSTGSTYTGPTSTRYGNVTLAPDLTPITYKATFLSDGVVTVDGVDQNNPSCDYNIEGESNGKAFTLPASAKDYYDFKTWKVNATVGNWTKDEEYAAGASVAGKYGDVTFTATWTPKEYTVTYVLDEKNNVAMTKKIPYGTQAPDLEPAEKVKAADAQYTYEFQKWDRELGTVRGDTTYTAIYTETLRSYNITWILPTTDDGDQTYSGEQTEVETFAYGTVPSYKNGAIPTLASNNEADHRWSFAGWALTKDGTPVEVSAVTGPAVYYAVFTWMEAPSEITWSINGTETVDYCAVGSVPVWKGAPPAKPDENGYKYVFTGWTPALVAAERGESYTYTAQFDKVPQTYTYKLYPNGGTLSEATEGYYTLEQSIDFPLPSIPGYDFTGWALDLASGSWEAGTVVFDGEFDTDGYWGNVTFTAQYAPAVFTVTYEEKPSGVTVPSAKNFTIKDTFTLGTASREGYTHIGWIVDEASGNWVAGQTISADSPLAGYYGDVTVSPLWQVNTYTVHWVSGSVSTETYVNYGSAIVARAPVNKAGYTAAWEQEIPDAMPAGDLTFNAVYTPVSYSVRIDLNGGEGAESFTYTIESEDVFLPAPTRTGASFAGWRVSVADGNWGKDAIVAAGTCLADKYGHITLTAQWEMDICIVTWKAGDVTKVAKWHYGDTPSYDGAPYKSTDESNSYVFAGWDKEIVPLTGDEVYTALFTPTARTYRVTWRVGSVETVQTYNYGETPSYGGTPQRASTDQYVFTFTGWNPEVVPVTGDIIYTAEFKTTVKIQSIELDISGTVLEISDKQILTATFKPQEATALDVKWEVINSGDGKTVVTINDAGEITAVNAGMAVIRASDPDGKFNSYCVVTVKPIILNYVSVSANGISTTQKAGSTLQLYATKMPENATNRDIVWTSSKPSVATVSESGLVTFVRTGKATITAKSKDGFASGSIEVETAAEDVELHEETKTYLVSFAGAGSNFIIRHSGADGTWDSIPYNSVSVVYKAGDEVIFKLDNTAFTPLVNGVSYKTPEADGYYHIRNLDKNLAIIDEIIPIGIDDLDPDKDKNDAPSFWQKIQDFFRKIVLFFRNLFK